MPYSSFCSICFGAKVFISRRNGKRCKIISDCQQYNFHNFKRDGKHKNLPSTTILQKLAENNLFLPSAKPNKKRIRGNLPLKQRSSLIQKITRNIFVLLFNLTKTLKSVRNVPNKKARKLFGMPKTLPKHHKKQFKNCHLDGLRQNRLKFFAGKF